MSHVNDIISSTTFRTSSSYFCSLVVVKSIRVANSKKTKNLQLRSKGNQIFKQVDLCELYITIPFPSQSYHRSNTHIFINLQMDAWTTATTSSLSGLLNVGGSGFSSQVPDILNLSDPLLSKIITSKKHYN